MSTDSSSRYSRAQFGAALGLADVTGLGWTEILFVADCHMGDDVPCALNRLIFSIVPTSSDPDVFTARDLSIMYSDWLCNHPNEWIQMSSFIAPFHQWTFDELLPYAAALVNRVNPVAEVQGLYFTLALEKATTFEELKNLSPHASTEAQKKAVLKALKGLPDVLKASTKQLLWFAGETDTPREVCEELVRRETENPNLNVTNISELIDVYKTCLPFPDLATRMRQLIVNEGMRNAHLCPMDNLARIPVAQEILGDAQKDSPLFAEVLSWLIDVGLLIRKDEFHYPLDFKTVATLEFRLRGEISPLTKSRSTHLVPSLRSAWRNSSCSTPWRRRQAVAPTP